MPKNIGAAAKHRAELLGGLVDNAVVGNYVYNSFLAGFNSPLQCKFNTAQGLAASRRHIHQINLRVELTFLKYLILEYRSGLL